MKKHTIEHQGRVIPFVIERKKVKNVNLRVCPDSSVVVSAPVNVPYDFIERFVCKKAPWILKNIERFDQKRLLSREREYKSGENIEYLGRLYRLEVLPAVKNETAYLSQGEIHLLVNDINNFTRKEEILDMWYKEQAELVFHDSLDRMLALFNHHFKLEKPKITIRTMKTRWGSCSWNRKKITLNTRLLRFPRECIDYVVLHELAHFLHQKHDLNFYDFLSLLMPDWKKRRKILKMRD